MTENDIEKCLWSLGKNIRSGKNLKKAVTKKLTKLQQKRPETIPIIREKALELLEIDEENFRERLELFVGDYIKIRDAIRQAGIKDDTVGFYSLFDGMVNNIAKAMIQPTRVAALLNVEHIKQAIKYIKSHGDFQVLYQPYVGDYLTKEDEDMILAYPTHNIEGHKGQKEEIFIVSPGTKLASGHNIGNNPTANLSVLELTPTLFLDTEVAINPDAFKEAIEQLRQNEGNIPVVLLTKETKDTLEAKLKGLDLKGVQFRTPQELGLENLQWDKDERVSLIDGIDNLGCIPLTKPLCETFKDLQRARDQV